MKKPSSKITYIALPAAIALTFFSVNEFRPSNIESKIHLNEQNTKKSILSSKKQSDIKIITAEDHQNHASLTKHSHDHHDHDEDSIIHQSQVKRDWEKKHFETNQNRKSTWVEIPSAKGKIELPFPPPPSAQNDQIKHLSKFDFILSSLAQIFLPGTAQANSADQYGDIAIDGNLSDWTIDDRINLPLDLPPYLATGNELYGKLVLTPAPTYIIALKSTGATLGSNTTFWLNTDQNANTGYKIWGAYGGAEHFVNLYSDATPQLYNKDFGWISSLTHAFSADQRIIEVAIPASSLGITSFSQSIDVLGDINDSLFLFPQDYPSGGQYSISGSTTELPQRTDFSKRVGIVYGEATKNSFFSDKAYSQLFMSLQHQTMMAGVAFDLLTEDDLTNISNIVNYDALIFPFFSHVSDAKMEQIHDTLYQAVYNYGIGIITADDWMTNFESGSSLSGDAYRNMKQLLGIGRVTGEGPVNIDLSVQTASHPAMEGYSPNEQIKSYTANWYSYFQAVPGQTAESLVKQTVTGSNAGNYPAVLASTTGGRNVHFATIGYMADTNLVWQSLQWILYGNETPVGLKLGRSSNLFVARNDMDLAMHHDMVSQVHFPLYILLENWKKNYNFVGSYFIDIGSDQPNGLWTDWAISTPLYQNYIKLDNEIGTHSWNHPHFTDQLNASELEFEFNQSMNKISTELGNKTWRDQNIRGAAVPGAPENLATATGIIQHLDYLSGGYSGSGAGYPSAFGYLTPDDTKVYLSPNMSFDFTLIQFGIPVGNPAVPTPLSAVEAEQFWAGEFDTLMNHASQPIIHWPWHDYGPTVSADPISGDGYTVAMFENTIAMAYNSDSEFVTSADVAQRINTFKNTNVTVDTIGSTVTATVNATQLGKFSLAVNTAPGEVIESVDNWYAYNDDHVFLDDNGGTYAIQLGSSVIPNSHITKLPMRSKLISLDGDGTNLEFTVEGEGWVEIALNQHPYFFRYRGVRKGKFLGGNKVALLLETFGNHTLSITR